MKLRTKKVKHDRPIFIDDTWQLIFNEEMRKA
jgi:hypothetical protein